MDMGEGENTEARLLVGEDEERKSFPVPLTTEFIQEAKRVGYIAGPMVAVNFSQYFLQVISVIMVGHLGQLYLSSTAIAISFCAVTGFSLLFGMSSALETLCGQAYGAEQYGRLATQTYTAIFCLLLTCIPVSLLWVFMSKLLTLIGQDPLISLEAGEFAVCLIPALYAYATLQPIVRFYQAQSLIIPLLVSSCFTLCFHVFLCWFLVFKSGLENHGAALAISISYWLNVGFLGCYMIYSSACAQTRMPITMDIFRGTKEFFRFAIPSASMICLEWWSFELLTMLSGLLPNPKLETSVLSVCLSILSTLYPIPEGLGAAARSALILNISLRCLVHSSEIESKSNNKTGSLTIGSFPFLDNSTRVSNELGAGDPRAARIAAWTVMFMAVSQAVTVSIALFACGRVFGYIFSNDREVINYVADMAQLLSVSVILDSLQVVLSGIARGCGWQDLGAYINLAAYYLVGVPAAAMLGFWLRQRGRGLWIGIQAGSFVQSLFLVVITSCIDWENQACKARDRLFKKAVQF